MGFIAILLFFSVFANQEFAAAEENPVIDISASDTHKMALKKDGSVVVWGSAFTSLTGPNPIMQNVRLISAGYQYSVFIKQDETVHTWGNSKYFPQGQPSEIKDAAQISAGRSHVLVLKSDGTVISWGEGRGTEVPNGLKGIVSISAGNNHSLALDDKGKVYAWGEDYGRNAIPENLGPVKAITESQNYCAALQKDGKVVWWGLTPNNMKPSAALNNIVDIKASPIHILALRADGKIVYIGSESTWQSMSKKEKEFYTYYSNIKAIETGANDNLLLLNNGKVVNFGNSVSPHQVPGDIRQPGYNTDLLGAEIRDKNGFVGYAGFGKTQQVHNKNIPYGINHIALDVRTADPYVSSVTIKTNQGEFKESDLIPLDTEGSTFISIKITAEDQKTAKTYFLRVDQALEVQSLFNETTETLTDSSEGVSLILSEESVLEQLNESKELDRLKVWTHLNNIGKNKDVSIPGLVMEQLYKNNKKAKIEVHDSAYSGIFSLDSLPIETLLEKQEMGLEDLTFIFQFRSESAPDFLEKRGITDLSSVYRVNILLKNENKVESILLNGLVESQFSRRGIGGNENSFYIDQDKEMAAVFKNKEIGKSLPFAAVEEGKIGIKHQWNEPFFFAENYVKLQDIKGLWNEYQVNKLSANRIVLGKPDGTFEPNQSTTRIQFAVILTRALGLEPVQKYNQEFKDVSGNEWFVPELMSAVNAGIVKGSSGGRFNPNEPVTREQAAAMISRAMKETGYEKLKLNESKDILHFSDASKIGIWAREDVKTLVQADIISGKTDGTFDPGGYTTRSQMVKMLYQFLKLVEYEEWEPL
ncbi:cadherin-like protein [Cytobacillus oceanisediminis]|uniref:Cadherin-like protein n=2 Tax=Cytobacillus oceanisediminis TaxID=665099 RepID=A0A2V3A8K5_9BACI|nr:cadherin-like protein [Cytobacillus oceanisediminis]